MKGVKHYKRDGTLHTGSSHKMPNGVYGALGWYVVTNIGIIEAMRLM